MRYIAGELLNFLEQARAITPNPAVDALFPPSALYDGYAHKVARFGSNTANPSWTIDLAMKGADSVDNGNLDSWSAGAPLGWTKATSGTGTVAETTVGAEVKSGSAAKVNKGNGSAQIQKRYRVRAGQRLTFSTWMRIAGAGSATLYVQNAATKKYLNTSQAWVSGLTPAATEAASTSYVEKTAAFTVEDWLACQASVVELLVTFADIGAGGAGDFSFVDDSYLWPHTNVIVLSGHNVEPGLTTEWRSSTDNFAASNDVEVTLTTRQPSFYGLDVAGVTRRYARIAWTGTQSDQAGPIHLGEFGLTYLEAALMPPDWGHELKLVHDDDAVQTPSGLVIARVGPHPRRGLRLTFGPRSDAHFREQRDEIVRRCQGRAWPLVFVPVDGEDVVIHGRLALGDWAILRNFAPAWQDELTLADNPFPRVTS